MKKLLFSLVLLASFQGFAQNRNCATMQVNAKNQELVRQQIASGQRKIKKADTRQFNRGQRLTTVYNIPVVVHVIHDGEGVGSGKNISAAQIQSQINALNEDFRNTNADKSNIPAVFQSLQADVQLNFCLAAIDKNGNAMAEPGIDRVDRSSFGWTAAPYEYAYIEENIKAATIWNPSNYLNIWVTDLSDDILGYSQFPDNSANLGGLDLVGGLATRDGVVIQYNAFGRTGNVIAPYNQGRTTTHEMGHFFGLRHLWGDEGCGTDFVNDTPPQQGENSGCPAFPKVSCNNGPNGDMFMNFMDYVNDACMHFFTADQKSRIQAVMAANTPRRSSLGASTVCNSTAIPVADFTFSPVNIVAGSTVKFNDNSSGNPSSWLWNFGGGTAVNTSTERHPTVTFNTAGSFQVSLTATNGNGSHTVTKTIIVTSFQCIDTLTNFIGTPAIYSVTAPEQGYLAGHNSYMDKAKAEKFEYSGQPIKLTQLIYLFGVAKGTGKVNLTVWNANGRSGSPGTVLYTKEVSISDLKTNGELTIVNLPSTLTISGDFFVGFPLVYAPGDTVALLTNREAEVVSNTAWEQWDDGDWYEYSASWNMKLNHMIFVVFDNRAQPAASSATPICTSADVTNSATFTDASCGVIAKVEPAGAAIVSGSASTCVRIPTTTPTVNGQPYVQRLFDITPSLNATTSTGTITLFFRNEDFVNYNANRGTYPPLPTLAGGGNADPARSNLFISQQKGTSTTGLPGSYSGTTASINPDDDKINWNAALNAWEVTFNVSGFSGFFVHSGVVSSNRGVTFINRNLEIISLTPTIVNKETSILNITSKKKIKLELVITDVQGRLIQKQPHVLQLGSNNLSLDFSKLSSGIYNISGHTTEGKTKTVRFVKQ